MTYEFCRHVVLRGKCETCDLAEELAEANRDRAELLAMLRNVQWGALDQEPDGFMTCASGCGISYNHWDVTSGHRPMPKHAAQCEIAAILKRMGE